MSSSGAERRFWEVRQGGVLKWDSCAPMERNTTIPTRAYTFRLISHPVAQPFLAVRSSLVRRFNAGTNLAPKTLSQRTFSAACSAAEGRFFGFSHRLGNSAATPLFPAGFLEGRGVFFAS